MFVSDDIRKCVVFLGYRLANGDYEFAGSAFYLGEISGERAVSVSLVTAKHVIDGIRHLGLDEVFIRYNEKSGESKWESTRLADWMFHPSDISIDVAVLRRGVPDAHDHLVIPTSLVASSEALKTNDVGLGDEVFVTGLFKHHAGARRNVPIVRVGNIAAMQEVQTKGFGLIDAYLIEARSIGGISGSPVFVNLGSVRRIGGKEVFRAGGPTFLLLGLIHGHYDIKNAIVDEIEADVQKVDVSTARLNSGIAIVVPIQKILDVLKKHQVTPLLFEHLAVLQPSAITATILGLDEKRPLVLKLDKNGRPNPDDQDR